MTNHSRQLNSSRNTSMTSMPRSGTPVSHLRLPSMVRSEFGDTTASYTDCNTPLSRVHSAVNAHAYLVTAPGTQDSPSSGLTHIPSPMFDSLASLNSEEEEEQMRVAAAAVAAERDGGPPCAPTPSTDSQSDNASRRTNAQGVPSAGEPAPGMLMSVQASQLRSSLPVAGREVAAAKQDDATDLVGAGAQASLPLHVKVDLARSKRVRQPRPCSRRVFAAASAVPPCFPGSQPVSQCCAALYCGHSRPRPAAALQVPAICNGRVNAASDGDSETRRVDAV